MSKPKKKAINIYVEPDLRRQIDQARGDIPLTRYVVRAVKDRIERDRNRRVT